MLLPGFGWIGLDPTMGQPVGPRHVRVAYGRDYGDVAPVRGVYKGHAGQQLFVDVGVRPALDDDGQEHLEETAAGTCRGETAGKRAGTATAAIARCQNTVRRS